MGYLNATWYGGDYETALETKTGLSSADTKLVFDDATEGSFGAFLKTACQQVATQYGCIDDLTKAASTNCTAESLAALQWGSLGVTRQPDTNWNLAEYTYFPISDTVAGWGDATCLPFGDITDPIEYPQTTGSLESSWTYIDMSVGKIMLTDSIDGGLKTFFNW